MLSYRNTVPQLREFINKHDSLLISYHHCTIRHYAYISTSTTGHRCRHIALLCTRTFKVTDVCSRLHTDNKLPDSPFKQIIRVSTLNSHLVVNDASPVVSRSIDASPVVSRSISSDCRAAPSSVGTSGGSIGGAGSLAPHLLAALALYCFAGKEWVDLALILICRRSVRPSVCFHLKGSRRNCPLHPGLLPFPLPCPYWLHTNGAAYLKSLQVSAPGRCSERSPVRFQLCLSRWVNVTRSQLGFSSRHHEFCSPSELGSYSGPRWECCGD